MITTAALTLPHKALSLEKARAIITCKVRYATFAAMIGPMTVIVAQPVNVDNTNQTSSRIVECADTCNKTQTFLNKYLGVQG